MIEKESFGEQPKETPYGVATQIEEKAGLSDGSPIGKFKDVNMLLSAYNSLQAEFTKKCQKLAEYEKKQDNTQVPCFDRENWQDSVNDFFTKNPEARELGEEIAQTLSSDKTLALGQSPLYEAYNNILKKKCAENNDFLNDGDKIVDYVLKNEDLVGRLIAKFTESIPKTPTLISSKRSSAEVLTPTNKPKNLDEAKEMVNQMFN